MRNSKLKHFNNLDVQRLGGVSYLSMSMYQYLHETSTLAIVPLPYGAFVPSQYEKNELPLHKNT